MKKVTFTILLALNFLVLFAQTCPTDAIIMSATISGDTSTSATIETQNTVVVNGPTTFSAPTVTLKPGFSVPAGQTFTAETTGCTATTTPNGTCAAPFVLNYGQDYSGNNITYGINTWDTYDDFSGYTGKEVIHTLTIAAHATVEMDLIGNTQDLALYVYSVCDNSNTFHIIHSDIIGDTSPENIIIPSSYSSRTVYVIVDGWSGAASNYTLTAEVLPPFAPGSEVASSRNSTNNSRIAVSNTANLDVNFEVYPNPATQFVNLNYTTVNDTTVEIDLYNMSGARLKTLLPLQEKSAGQHQIRVDVSAFDAGMYYVMLRQEGNVQTKKLVLAK